MKVKLVDPMPIHPTLCYPGTHQPLKAVAVRADGSVVWPLLGGDGDDDVDEEPDDNEDEETEEDEAEGDDSEVNAKSNKKKSGPVTREDYDRVKNHLSRADQKKAALEKENADLKKFKEENERKGNTELQNLQKDHTELVKNHEAMQSRFQKLAITNAFLTASAQAKVVWHDPKVAMRAAELEDLEIDEDGNVVGIEEAVKTLAKSHKYLVNKDTGADDDEEEEKKPRRGASGSGIGSVKSAKGKKTDGKISREDLIKRFPALGRNH